MDDDLLQSLDRLSKDRRTGWMFMAVWRACDCDLQMIGNASVRVHRHCVKGKNGCLKLKRRVPPAVDVSHVGPVWPADDND